MDYEITGGSTFPVVKISLNTGEAIKAESGAMVALSEGLELKGKMEGGLKRSIGRMFSGESFFMQSIEAVEKDGWALLSTTQLGTIAPLEVASGDEWILQKAAFVAASTDVEVSTKVQSLTRGFLSGEGFFVIRLSGAGTTFISTYGSMHEIDVPAGQSVLVDNGHLVAWRADMKYEIAKGAKSWVSSVTSGEGLACRFSGPGTIKIQTRSPRDFGKWIQQFMPPPPKTSN